MALAPRLEFRQSQQLVMTPQLQQAIKLLQLSNLELAEFVEQQLEENPFLERAGEQDGADAGERHGEDAPDAPETSQGDQSGAALDLESETASSRASDALDAPQEESAAGQPSPCAGKFRRAAMTTCSR